MIDEVGITPTTNIITEARTSGEEVITNATNQRIAAGATENNITIRGITITIKARTIKEQITGKAVGRICWIKQSIAASMGVDNFKPADWN